VLSGEAVEVAYEVAAKPTNPPQMTAAAVMAIVRLTPELPSIPSSQALVAILREQA
jgi:hypothetical protein